MAEKEYIEREATIEQARLFYCKDCNSYNGVLCRSCGFNDAMLFIEDAPTADVVEVVRCKDCKHYEPYEGEEHKGDCAELVGLESCIYKDDFCSYGERKEQQ